MNSGRIALAVAGISLLTSVASAQSSFRKLATFAQPGDRDELFSGGREVAMSDDGNTLIVAFYGSWAQLVNLKTREAIAAPVRTYGDGQIG